VKRLADQSLYEILEVKDDAAGGDIAAACERALALYGPGSLATYSLMAPEEAELLTRRIEEARTTLLDPEARVRYDETLRSRRPEPRPPASGAGGSVAIPPPVIPALKPEAAAAADLAAAAVPPAAEPSARPAILLSAAVEAAGPADRVSAPAPILLRQQVPAEAPARTPPPLPPRAPAPVLPAPVDGAPWTGDVLRQVREARGISVQQIAERTKVTRHHIENIEADHFGALPAPVYLRGILLAVARELRLDGQKVARSYLERAASGSKAR
jgi:hypothetical protein